jgi:hypothetical protein
MCLSLTPAVPGLEVFRRYHAAFKSRKRAERARGRERAAHVTVADDFLA